MAYDNSALRARSGDVAATPAVRSESRYLGEGFRQEADFRDAGAARDATATSPTVAQPVSSDADTDSTLSTNRRVPATPNLDYVFDDPADGEPGRDRMLVHGLWELGLALVVAGVGYLLYRAQPAAFNGGGLRSIALSASVLGALALAAALALRVGAANLAVGAVAGAAALYFGQHGGGGLISHLAVVVGVCAVIGLVQGLVVVGLHVPGWAASIGVGLVLLVWSNRQAAVALTDAYDPGPHAYYWFIGFCALSLVGGVAGLVPSVRRLVGRFRPVADPAERRGFLAAGVALGAIVASTILAGVGGVLSVSQTGRAAPTDGLELTALALGAALLGGTSAFGRRGGVFGTILAVVLLTLAMAYAGATDRSWPIAAFAAIAIGLGLAMTRLVERFGHPPQGDDEDDDWASSKSSDGWSSSRPSWQTTSATTTASNLWGADDAWGTADRR
jgi:ribose/xylose/arabinose/galactoside ABC-type transport system permease subunit